MKTADEIRESIKNRDYENQIPYPTSKKVRQDNVFDENQSVKWNKEMIEAHNKVVDEEFAKYRKGEYKANFYDDCVEYIMGCNFTKKQASLIYSKISERYRDDGYGTMIDFIEYELDYVDEILKAGV
jgi:hypothetical protein